MSHQPQTGRSAMVKRRSANKGRALVHQVGVHTNATCDCPTLIPLLAAMELMHTRLQDLTKRCNKFSAKYARKPEDTGLAHDSISITFRCYFFC